MAECMRIRLEFKNFKTAMKSSLLVYKKKDYETIKQLSVLIQNRFEIKQNISLFIEGFLLQNDETIEAVRDDDLIVVKPNMESKPKNDYKPKPKSKQNFIVEPEIESKPKNVYKPKPKSKQVSTAVKTENTAKPKQIKTEITPKRRHGKQIDDCSDSIDSVDSIHLSKKQKIKPSNALDILNECIDICAQRTDALIKTEPKEEPNELNDDSMSDIYSNRNTPLRKAFKAATKCLSEREPVKPSNPSKYPKRKPLSREAREPVDKFSPIIPIKDLKSNQQYSYLFAEMDFKINGNKMGRKQSARKTFPKPSNNINNTKTGKKPITNVTTTTTSTTNSTTNSSTNSSTTTSITINNNSLNVNNVVIEEPNLIETIETESNSRDFSDCEPLGELPNIGDLIAFKFVVESKTNGLPEATKFQKGSVINRKSNMIDVLIENNNNNDISDTTVDIDERRVQILKIDWSTIIEPKIIQRQHLLLSDSS